jgi:electron transfer flavoprotein alpha subunit
VAAILVHIDLDGDRPNRSSIAALAAGRNVASSWGATLYAAVIAHDNSPVPAESAAHVPGIDAIETVLAKAGADKVVVALTSAVVSPLWASVGNAWTAVLDHLRPRLVLFGADAPSAPELAPRTGARIGARLLSRARAIGIDDVELRDRDSGYARAGDSGAAVALIGRAEIVARGDDDIDLVVLPTTGGADTRLELAGTGPAETAQLAGALVALGDDALASAADARRLADALGATLVGSAAAVRGGAVPASGLVDRATPLVPELCIVVGGAQVDVAGAARLVKIGGKGGKGVDGALSGAVDTGVRDLVKQLEKL